MNLFRSASKSVIDQLGEPVTYTRQSGESYTLKAVLDYEYFEAFEHATREPILTFADLEISPSVGDRVLINDITYQISQVEPDGIGVTSCRLHKV